MSIFKCKICGGSLDIDNVSSVATCEYCGTKQTLPKFDDERRANLYDRANHFRRNNDFDKAMVELLKKDNLLTAKAECKWLHEDDKIIIFTKGDYVFAFNFHPTKSFDGYFIPTGKGGSYGVALSSDCKIK